MEMGRRPQVAEIRRNAALLMLALLVTQIAVTVQAQTANRPADYRIGPGDVLRLNVLEMPQLDRELTIQSDGTAFVPQVGEVSLAGLTLPEAEEEVRRRLRLFNPSVDAVALQIVQYNALRVYVLGAVANPGAHTFTSTPTVWDAVRAAGGPNENANLAAARIVSEVEGRSQTRMVNLSGLLTGGMVPEVVLRSGDTLIIPAVGEGSLAALPTSGVQIVGAVGAPALVPVEGPTRLLTCLLMSGAPLEKAKLESVWWVHNEGGEAFTSRHVDMKQFFERGSLAGNPLIYPGDSIHVDYKQPSFFEKAFPYVIATTTTVIALLLALDRLEN
jgi:protein involved in polysaccharide export with SLBB domain